MPNSSNYYKLKLSINCLTGGIQETYNLFPPTLSINACIPIALGIMQYRGQILAKGAAIVDAVISKETFAANYPDGYRFPASSLYGPILMKKISDAANEPVIEPYGDPTQGIAWQLDTGAGVIDHRLIRMIRQTWVAGNAFTGNNVLPGGANLPPFTISSGIVTLAVAIGKYMDCVRDNTFSVARGTSDFRITPYARTASSNWKINGISKKAVGFAWPRVQGRQPAFA